MIRATFNLFEVTFGQSKYLSTWCQRQLDSFVSRRNIDDPSELQVEIDDWIDETSGLFERPVMIKKRDGVSVTELIQSRLGPASTVEEVDLIHWSGVATLED